MRKILFFVILAGLMPLSLMAQDDDLYFTPKKKAAVETIAKQKAVNETPAYHVGSDRDVDEYNRRGKYWSHYQVIGADEQGNDIIEFQKGRGVYPDSAYVDTTFVGKYYDTVADENDYTYCRRMSRWDGWYDPWFYSYHWGYGPYWRYAWHTPWYGGWYDPWFDPWYDPWYYGYGWGWPWYGGYGGYWGYGWPHYHGAYWGRPGYWGGGYVANVGGNPRGLTGYRTWNGPNRGTATAQRGTTSGRKYGTASDRSDIRSFGGRTNNTMTPTTPNPSFGTRNGSSSFGSGSTPSFSGGNRGGFGGGHSMSGGGGGRFGGGRR